MAVWVGVTLTLTSLPGAMIPDVPPVLPVRIDRVVHFGCYAVLGVLVARALRQRTAGVLLVVSLCVAVLGVADELHQELLPDREAEVWDWVMDAVGGVVGLTLGTLLMRTRLAAWLA